MATWTGAVQTTASQSKVGCVYWIEGGYANVVRNGNTVSYNFGFRTTREGTISNYGFTVYAWAGGREYWGRIKQNGGSYGARNTWYYATVGTYLNTTETLFAYNSVTVSGSGAGTITDGFEWTDGDGNSPSWNLRSVQMLLW